MNFKSCGSLKSFRKDGTFKPGGCGCGGKCGGQCGGSGGGQSGPASGPKGSGHGPSRASGSSRSGLRYTILLHLGERRSFSDLLQAQTAETEVFHMYQDEKQKRTPLSLVPPNQGWKLEDRDRKRKRYVRVAKPKLAKRMCPSDMTPCRNCLATYLHEKVNPARTPEEQKRLEEGFQFKATVDPIERIQNGGPELKLKNGEHFHARIEYETRNGVCCKRTDSELGVDLPCHPKFHCIFVTKISVIHRIGIQKVTVQNPPPGSQVVAFGPFIPGSGGMGALPFSSRFLTVHYIYEESRCSNGTPTKNCLDRRVDFVLKAVGKKYVLNKNELIKIKLCCGQCGSATTEVPPPPTTTMPPPTKNPGKPGPAQIDFANANPFPTSAGRGLSLITPDRDSLDHASGHNPDMESQAWVNLRHPGRPKSENVRWVEDGFWQR